MNSINIKNEFFKKANAQLIVGQFIMKFSVVINVT
jgi:hypothetical protein